MKDLLDRVAMMAISKFNLPLTYRGFDTKKELIDQAAHLLVGFALTLVLSIFMTPIGGAMGTLTIAFVREMLQHRGKRFYELGDGSRLDMLFWILGISVALLALSILT